MNSKKYVITETNIQDAERLKAIFEKRKKEAKAKGIKFNQATFGEKYDWSQGAVGQYLNAMIPLNLSAALKFAEGLNVKLEEFSPSLAKQVEGEMPSSEKDVNTILDQIRALDNVRVDYGDDDDSGDIRIPIYDVYFCCGDGDAEDFAFEEVKGERKFPPHFFTDKNVKPENFKLVCAKNDSQKPYINEHDMVGIDISDREIKDGEMYAILLDGERMFKRIFREPGNVLRLHCYNPDYPDKIVTADNHSSLVIVGREVYRAG